MSKMEASVYSLYTAIGSILHSASLYYSMACFVPKLPEKD